MKLRQVVKECGDILALGLSEDFFQPQAEVTDGRVARLLNCFRSVYDELYRDYASALGKTVVESVDGKVDLSPYKLCRVVSLVDGEGNRVSFRYSDNALAVKDGRYNMCYARLPENVEWDGDVIMPSPCIGERVLIYGMLRDYLASLHDWANAAQWDKRFKDALQVACGKSPAKRMPVRGWL